ncbi:MULTISPECIES: dihydroxyacetone kinase subunit DhaK [unclassified Paenibacillus]|uniref:dihydroxyacetone kinase subunit DhaK n=1 Tax=unclassified Paenibacillus TaxID=185978 RepID=UPI001AEB466C|nr:MULTISPECIES: dihydroxyacetone kinase subunit DhaK [unclassified Paenibacillus]MBP1154896.1 dihydroxyacetone kinase-like protein [Paenibacillus sp. PvP091]MBP1169720.1 dihydroxyacetone kinase-like protein [Paenibacillus sp. PvR098]MBP2440748.1 dihydroxyacetone kinase-like protein [Paenibacillus sp. PvP052]
MKKIINDPMAFVDETLEGIVYAYPKQLRFPSDEKKGIVRADAPVKGKVAIATGGGSGHLPVFLGYVGKGLADGSSVGNVFTSPSADAMVNVAKEIHGGEGVLFLYGHYFGDKMNFDLAAEMLEEEDGISVKTVRVSDDAASAPRDSWQNRRGVAGIFFAYKIAGACAETMVPLEKVKEVTERAVSKMATMGVALSSCIIPASGNPTFDIEEDEMEIGMGIHGEPGIRRSKLKPAAEIVQEIVQYLSEDLTLSSGDEVAMLVNGSGSTPLEELYIVNREVHILLSKQNIKIYRTYVGEYATSLDMAGCSITLLKLDSELKGYLDAPADSPFFKQFEGV